MKFEKQKVGLKEKKHNFVIVFLVVSVLLSLSFLTFLDVRVEATPSVVGTSTTPYAVYYSPQRKTFYAHQLFWVFYTTGSSLCYRTSSDGTTWSGANNVRSCDLGHEFSICFDGTYVHYAWTAAGGGADLFYRRGTPNADGSITWTAAEQYTGATDSGDPSICVDSSGQPVIAYHYWSGTVATVCITKSTNTTGGWSTASGFPKEWSIDSAVEWMNVVVPLTNEKFYHLWVRTTGGVKIRGALWNGTGWQTYSGESWENVTITNAYYKNYMSACTDNDEIHLVFKGSGSHIKYIKYDGSWGTEETVINHITYVDAESEGVISIDKNMGNLYCFWLNDDDHVYYKKKSGGSWDVSATNWIDETTDDFAKEDRLACSYEAYQGKISLIYVTKTASPYKVKFAYLDLGGADTQPPTYSNLGVNTTIANAPCKFYCKWTDNIALSGYIFGTNNTGSWVNDTWTSLSGNPAWSNVTKTLNSTVGVKIAYRFWCNDTSNNWADTGLTFLTTSSESVTIEIYDSWISDTRLDYGSQVTIKFRHRYSNNQTACETGTSYVNGTSCAINSTGWITYTKTYSAVVKYTFTISQVNVKGYTTFQMVTSDAEVIWDRLEVESYETGDNRANINSSVVYWWKLRYDYDNVAFTNTKGNCSIGATPATWSSYNSRWELNVLLPSTPQSYSQTLTFSDVTYGLTVITGTTSQSVIADRVNINSFTVYDNRINVGDTASFSVSGIYDYDSSVWSGTYTLNESTSKSSVGKYWYSIQSVTDSIYGLTAFQQTASNLYVIFDKLTVTFSANDTSPNIGETVTISWTITRQYDSSTVTSFTIDISRNGILWQTLTNNSKNDISLTGVTRIYTLYPSTVTDNTYGLTVAQANSVTVTWGGGITGSQPPASGDWEITENTLVDGTTVYVNGSINIRSPYIFTVLYSTIYMNNGSYNAEFGIFEESGATFIGYNSDFLNNTNYRYGFTMLGLIYFNYCEIRGFGYEHPMVDDYPGVKLTQSSAGSSINNTIIHETSAGIYLDSNTHDIHIENVTVYDGDIGFFMINAYNNTFVNTIAYFNKVGHYVYEPSVHNTFINTVSYNNTQHGYYIRGNNNTFNGCIAYYNGGDTRPYHVPPPTPEPWYYGFCVTGDYNVFDNVEAYEEFTGVLLWGNHNNFTNSKMHDSAPGYWGWLYGLYASYNLLENCETYNCQTGITISSHNTVINHTAHDGLEGIIIGDSHDILVENCTSYNMLSDGISVAGASGHEPYYTNVIIRNCTVFNCSGPGFGVGMNSANVTFIDCTSHNNWYGFGFYENASYVTVTGCSVYNNYVDFNFGFNTKNMKDINIINTPISGKLCFQNIPPLGYQNVTLEITSGVLNSTDAKVTMDSEGVRFEFTATNDVVINITYTMNPKVDSVMVSGDQGKSSRQIEFGDLITIDLGNDISMQFRWESIVFWLPMTFILGIIGLASMFAGPIYGIHQVKHEEYYEGFRTGLVITAIGAALVIAWLWI